MSRRKTAVKRPIVPDPKYANQVVARFVNRMMYSGKKSLAYSLFYDAMEILADKVKRQGSALVKTFEDAGLDPDSPMGDVFSAIIRKLHPILEVRSRRVGGSTYQIPVEVSFDRAQNLAMGWLLESARKRKGRTFSHKLSDELFDILQGRGESLKTRENTHKMAEANRAFAHFRW